MGVWKEKNNSFFHPPSYPTLSLWDSFFLGRQFMATRSRKPSRKYLIQKPNGQVTQRVQAVGPEHFGVLCFDCAKARSKFTLANFYGSVVIPPQTVAHTRGHLQAVVDQVRQACAQHQLHDLIVAIERTGEYHRPVQRACKQANFDTRLVHPLTSKQFRVPADPGNKTDDTDLAAIFRRPSSGAVPSSRKNGCSWSARTTCFRAPPTSSSATMRPTWGLKSSARSTCLWAAWSWE